MGEFRIASSAELTPDQLAGAAAVYEQAFRPNMRVPFAELAATGPADLLLAALDDAEPVGVAALRRLDQAGWTFLRYFAVTAGRRRTGLGRRLWTGLAGPLRAAGWPDRIAFEVEDPAHAPDETERAADVARIEFWRRCGCELLPVPGYVMPDITGLAPPEPMLLMAGALARPGELSAGQLSALVLGIYQERYRLDRDHPLVRAALAALAGPAG